jgi:hypothetical protein
VGVKRSVVDPVMVMGMLDRMRGEMAGKDRGDEGEMRVMCLDHGAGGKQSIEVE